jgi:hypothetical protein
MLSFAHPFQMNIRDVVMMRMKQHFFPEKSDDGTSDAKEWKEKYELLQQELTREKAEKAALIAQLAEEGKEKKSLFKKIFNN